MFTLFERINHRRNDKKIFLPFLVGVGLVSGLVSLWIGLRQSVWFDEAYSILVARQPIGDIIHLASVDTHPPLYYIFLHFWGDVFGWSELSLRLTSAAALAAAVVIAGLLIRRLFNARIAIGAVLLLMISPLLLRYGFEIRMYSIGLLIGIAATYCLVRAVERESGYKRWMIAYSLLVVLGMYVMYSLALLWMSHVVWLLYFYVVNKRKPRQLTGWFMAYAGSVVLFLPWLMTFLGQLSNGSLAPIGQPMNLENVLGIMSFNILYKPLFQIDALMTLLLVPVLAIITYALATTFKYMRLRHNVGLLAAYIGVPILILVIVSIKSSMYVERYLSFAAIGGVSLVGVALTALLIRERSKGTVAAVTLVFTAFLVGCMNLAVIGNFNFQRMQTPTVEQASVGLDVCEPSHSILAADPYVAIELSYYVTKCPLYFYSESDVLGGGYAPLSGSSYQIKDMTALAAKNITYVYYGDIQEQALLPSYHKKSESSYGALNVAQYALKEDR